MNTNNNSAPSNSNSNANDLDVLVPLEFKPEAITYKGTFVSKKWEVDDKDPTHPVKDLVVKVALEVKNELDQPVVVERRYNMLPRARGINDFKKDMANFLGYKLDKHNNIDEFPPRLLAQQSLIMLDGKPVTLSYKKSKRGYIEFDSFKPIEATPATAATTTTPDATTGAPVALSTVTAPAAAVATTPPVAATVTA